MYTIRVEDFIDVKESKSSFDVNDMIHICKRHNNPKREYLFVNKYQGKHYPANPKDVLRVFDELFYEIEKKYIAFSSPKINRVSNIDGSKFLVLLRRAEGWC